MFNLNKERYIVHFVREEKGTYKILKKKRIIPSTRLVSYSKNRVHLIDVSKPSYKEGLKNIYLIDIDSESEHRVKEEDGKENVYYGGQLRYIGSNLQYPAGILSFVTIENGIRQLSSTLHSKLLNTDTIILLLSVLACGIFAGLFFGRFI